MKIFKILGLLIKKYQDKVHTSYLSRKSGITIGKLTSVYKKSRIDCFSASYKMGGGITIGQNCIIGRDEVGYHGGMPFYTGLLADGEGSKITIGDNCRINGAYIHAKKNISIGSNCVLASGVNIIDANGHQVKSLNRTVGRDEPKEIVIGNNVWICMNATILKGSVIGDNSVVTAGSVINGTVPPNSIASSNGQLVISEIRF